VAGDTAERETSQHKKTSALLFGCAVLLRFNLTLIIVESLHGRTHRAASSLQPLRVSVRVNGHSLQLRMSVRPSVRCVIGRQNVLNGHKHPRVVLLSRARRRRVEHARRVRMGRVRMGHSQMRPGRRAMPTQKRRRRRSARR